MVQTNVEKLQELIQTRELLGEYYESKQSKLRYNEDISFQNELTRLDFFINKLANIPLGLVLCEYRQQVVVLESKINIKNTK